MFADALVETGLDTIIDAQASKGATFTVLAPTDEAIRAGSPYPEGRRVTEEDWLRFHVLRGVSKLHRMDGRKLTSMLKDRFVNINIYGKWDRMQQVSVTLNFLSFL
jgi:hypothetical protein